MLNDLELAAIKHKFKRRIGITGSRAPTRESLAVLHANFVNEAKTLGDKVGNVLVVTGGCIGIDALAATAAFRLKFSVLCILPADMSRVDKQAKRWCSWWYQMPWTSTYRDRDQMIVDMSTELQAYPLHAEDDGRSKRSGTWLTVRLARKASVPVEINYGATSPSSGGRGVDRPAEGDPVQGEAGASSGADEPAGS